MDGCIYRTKDGECDLYAEGGKFTAFCDLEHCDNIAPTNADHIRSMTDEELAMWCYRITTDAMSILQIGNTKQTKSCLEWLNWLKQKVKK